METSCLSLSIVTGFIFVNGCRGSITLSGLTTRGLFIRAAQSQVSQNNGAQLAICFDGRIIGIIGHHQIDWRNRLTSLGYWVGQEFQGKGLVTTATRALVGHAFDEVNLNRVEIRCAVGNRKSRAIPIRLGFSPGRPVAGC